MTLELHHVAIAVCWVRMMREGEAINEGLEFDEGLEGEVERVLGRLVTTHLAVSTDDATGEPE